MTPKRRFEIAVILIEVALAVLYVWWYENNVPWRKRPYPVELPAPTLAPARYVYYFPIYMASPKPAGLWGKGVASTASGQFNKELGASWFYTWSFCDAPGCVPMIRNWDALPLTCPPVMLLGNEPNSIPPYGFSEPPEEASEFSRAVRAQCPDSWLIVGNVALPEFLGISGYEWLQRYIDNGGEYDQLGAHLYISPNGGIDQTQALDDLELYFPGIPKCITEFGSYNPRDEIFSALTDYVVSHYGCFAVFTDHDDDWDVYGTNLNLIDDEGELTARGKMFASRKEGEP